MIPCIISAVIAFLRAGRLSVRVNTGPAREISRSVSEPSSTAGSSATDPPPPRTIKCTNYSQRGSASGKRLGEDVEKLGGPEAGHAASAQLPGHYLQTLQSAEPSWRCSQTASTSTPDSRPSTPRSPPRDARMISYRDLSRRVNRVSDAPRAAAIGVGVTLPYSPTGKLLRRVLRDEAAADQATTARL